MDILIAGLGNPGKRYEGNRHNVGFMAADWIVQHHGTGSFRSKDGALRAEARVGSEVAIIVKPARYMNLSGAPVVAAASFYKIPPAAIWVIHDDMDVPFGRIKLKVGGSAGGHNGIKDIDACLGTTEYGRIRVGVGRPRPGSDAADYVLSDFDAVQRAGLPDVLRMVYDALVMVRAEGLKAAQNVFHAESPKSIGASGDGS